MKIANLPNTFVAARPAPMSAAQGPSTQLAPGDAYVPSEVSPKAVAASAAVIGAGAGIFAGVSQGVAAGIAGSLVGAGGGFVAGAVLGGIAARVINPSDEWGPLRYAQFTAPAGAIGGVIGGALAGASASGFMPAAILGVAGAATGALGAWYLTQN